MPSGLDHERMRWNTLRPDQLRTRLRRITREPKLADFLLIALERQSISLLGDGILRAQELGFTALASDYIPRLLHLERMRNSAETSRVPRTPTGNMLEQRARETAERDTARRMAREVTARDRAIARMTGSGAQSRTGGGSELDRERERWERSWATMTRMEWLRSQRLRLDRMRTATSIAHFLTIAEEHNSTGLIVRAINRANRLGYRDLAQSAMDSARARHIQALQSGVDDPDIARIANAVRDNIITGIDQLTGNNQLTTEQRERETMPNNTENGVPKTPKEIFHKGYRLPSGDTEPSHYDYNWVVNTPRHKIAYMLCEMFVSSTGNRRWVVRMVMMDLQSREEVRFNILKQSSFLPSEFNLTSFTTKKRAYRHINKVRTFYRNEGYSGVIGIPPVTVRAGA